MERFPKTTFLAKDASRHQQLHVVAKMYWQIGWIPNHLIEWINWDTQTRTIDCHKKLGLPCELPNKWTKPIGWLKNHLSEWQPRMPPTTAHQPLDPWPNPRDLKLLKGLGADAFQAQLQPNHRLMLEFPQTITPCACLGFEHHGVCVCDPYTSSKQRLKGC